MGEKMVKILEKKPLESPRFIFPYEIIYNQDGKKKRWEMVEAHSSVSVLLYHTQKDGFILVKQLRIPLLLNNDDTDGFTYELCAGIVDKNLSLEMIAKEEILEECGYDVAVESIKKITSFYTSVGFSGAKQTLFYCEVDESMRKNGGGGIDDESIEVIFLPQKEAKKFMFDEQYKKTPGLLAAFFWFFEKKN